MNFDYDIVHEKHENKHPRNKFTKEEDERLLELVKTFGTKNWQEISRYMPQRCGRQCRDRYNNYLYQNFRKGKWTKEEDEIIIKKYFEIGAHWVEISKSLPGRSSNDVKNRWHKNIAKKKLNSSFYKYKKQHRKSQKSDYINKGYEEEEDINQSSSPSLQDISKNTQKNSSQTDNNVNSESHKNFEDDNKNDVSLFSLFDFTEVWDLFPNEKEKHMFLI